MTEFYQYIQNLFIDTPLLILFLSGFLSSTLLPGSSEISLYAALKFEHLSLFSIIFVATLGNTLGGMTNYFIGLWFPDKTLKQKRGQQLQVCIQRYGYWALLLSWLPIIGDPLCVVAGWLRMNKWLCLLFICIGKASRYIFLTFLFKGFL